MNKSTLISLVEEKFDKSFNWKDCGNFLLGEDDVVRECMFCGFKIQLCANCFHDHHVEEKEGCIKSFISQQLSFVIDETIKELEIEKKPELKFDINQMVAISGRVDFIYQYGVKIGKNWGHNDIIEEINQRKQQFLK